MRSTITASGSILVHGAILAGLFVSSLFYVEPLAEPFPKRLPVELFEIQLPPAAAAPAPPPQAAGGEDPHRFDGAIPDQVQPQAPHPDDLPSDSPGGKVTGTEEGVPRGVPGGIPGGIPGGVPGGDLAGIPGGFSDGIPGSPLQGLPGADRPVHLTGEIRPPERVSFVKPEYPDMARRVRAEGKVILEIVVGRTGSIEEVMILRSNPLFDIAAVEAVRKWRYRPALQSGRAVKVYLSVVVSFELQ